MNAEQMFEKLGYSLEVNSEDLIKYSKDVCGYTFFRFRPKEKEFCSGYQSVAHTITRDELKAVIQQFKELGWFESEQEQENNLDHYKHEILEACMWDLAVVKGKPKQCNKTNCSDCDFKSSLKGCHKKVMDWLK